MDNKLIARVRKMEDDFNMVRSVMNDMEDAMSNYEAVQRRIERLYNYMGDGQWLKDFESDERGELPKNMRRGVLSEDALDQLLADITLMDDRMRALVGDELPEGFVEDPIGFEEYDPMYNDPEDIPEEAGSFIIVVREDGEGFAYMPEDPQEFEGHDVLYVGELENLRNVTEFFKGNSAQSFLRLNIGLLNYLEPEKSEKGTRFSAEDERWLSNWLKENILVFYQVNPDHESVTNKLTDELDPLLNLDHKSAVWEDYRRKLDVMRNTCVEEADYEKVNTKKSVIKLPKKGKDLESAIREATADNAARIPEKLGVAFVETMIYYAGQNEDAAIAMLFGGVNDYGEKEQCLTIWSSDFKDKKSIKSFLKSAEGKCFNSEEEGEEFEFSAEAGSPQIPELLVTVLKKHLGVTDSTKLVISTKAEVFRSDK